MTALIACCASCSNANDNGIIGSQTICTVTGAVMYEADTCGEWAEDTRSFAERYPDHPAPHGDSLSRYIRILRGSGEAEEIPLDAGVVLIQKRASA